MFPEHVIQKALTVTSINVIYKILKTIFYFWNLLYIDLLKGFSCYLNCGYSVRVTGIFYGLFVNLCGTNVKKK